MDKQRYKVYILLKYTAYKNSEKNLLLLLHFREKFKNSKIQTKNQEFISDSRNCKLV